MEIFKMFLLCKSKPRLLTLSADFGSICWFLQKLVLVRWGGGGGGPPSTALIVAYIFLAYILHVKVRLDLDYY